MKIWLLATRQQRYGGRPLAIGDRFQAKPAEARILKILRRAEDAPLETFEASAGEPEQLELIETPQPEEPAADANPVRTEVTRPEDAPVADAVPDFDAMATDLRKLTNAKLHDLAAAEDTAVEPDDNKAILVGKIVAARRLKAQG